jgi:hypothetical protein
MVNSQNYKILKENVVESFKNVKKDILSLMDQVSNLSILNQDHDKNINILKRHNTNLRSEIEYLKNENLKLRRELKKNTETIGKIIEYINLNNINNVNIQKDSHYVSSKKSDKFHDEHCAFAKKIKSENIIVFDNKEDALNKHLKPCVCIK